MSKFKSYNLIRYSLVILLFVLSACTDFEGIRAAKYDNKPIVKKEEAIDYYQKHSEIIGNEKEFYLRHSFSEDILRNSLEYPKEEAVLLKEGKYRIGDDLPAGRVSLLGNESVFTSDNYTVHVGNMIVRDTEGVMYFENLFHSTYGQQIAQLDFISGHEIEIVGENSEITVFYSPEFPENPYLLMELPQLVQNLGVDELTNPIERTGNGQVIKLTAGIFEVGIHLEEGKYKINNVEAPHMTEMFLFRKQIKPRVIELVTENGSMSNQKPTLALKNGDKIYLHLVKQLELYAIE